MPPHLSAVGVLGVDKGLVLPEEGATYAVNAALRHGVSCEADYLPHTHITLLITEHGVHN